MDRLAERDDVFRLYLRWKYGIVREPSPLPKGLMFPNPNRALQGEREWKTCCRIADLLGLPLHDDLPKNWDTLIALEQVLRHTDPSARILDAGAEKYSKILTWLFLYGYRNLIGNNIVFDRVERRGPIRFEPGNIEKTRFKANTFEAITCLSVIEHGVNLARYFKEMARILKPGGMLVTSTDYFETKISSRGKSAYGVPVKIFSKRDLQRMFSLAEAAGLRLAQPMKTQTSGKPVHWKEVDLRYTFSVFVLFKTDSKAMRSKKARRRILKP